MGESCWPHARFTIFGARRRCGAARCRRRRVPRGRTDAPFALARDPEQNVLLVTIDTLRADALSAYGGPAQTPNLDRARLARRAVHVRARAHRRHAAVAHDDPLGPAAVRARRARQQRLSRQARHADARDAAQAARLRDRRVRRRLSADQALRPDARLRRLRRPDAGDARRDRDLDARAAAPTSSSAARSTGSASSRASSSPGCTSTIRTRRTGRPTEFSPQYAQQPYYGEVAFVDRALGPLFDRLARSAARRSSSSPRITARASASTAS